jgi:hypothetical protein
VGREYTLWLWISYLGEFFFFFFAVLSNLACFIVGDHDGDENDSRIPRRELGQSGCALFELMMQDPKRLRSTGCVYFREYRLSSRCLGVRDNSVSFQNQS